MSSFVFTGQTTSDRGGEEPGGTGHVPEEGLPVLDDHTSSVASSSSSDDDDVQMSTKKRSRLRTSGRRDVSLSSLEEDEDRRTPRRPRPKRRSSRKRL